MWETWVRSLGGEDPLEKGMETHSSILAWRVPWTEEPSKLQPMGLQRVGYDWATNTFTFPARWGDNYEGLFCFSAWVALTRWTFVSKVMSLLFNMLSRYVITFLPELNVAICVIQLWSLWTLVNFSLFYSQRAKWYAELPAQLLVSVRHSVSVLI